MSERYFVDTNILLYAHDRSKGMKHQRALQLIERLWESGEGVLSTQVLQELCVNLSKRVARPLPVAEIRRLIEDYLSWEVVTNSPQSVVRALEIQERHKISFWDALIVHAASSSGARVLYSEDLSEGQKFGDVEVINPVRS